MVMKMTGSVLKMLFNGKCDIYRVDEVTDKHGITRHEFKKIYGGKKCRISYLSAKNAVESETETKAKQTVRIYLMRNCDLRCGDIVDIEQHGKKERYKACGQVKVYSSHQEAELEIYSESI